MHAIGYVRVSTGEQVDSGAGLAAQRKAITGEIERRGWTLDALHEDAGYSAKNLNRPALTGALTAVKEGEGRALVVAKLDRLSRSLFDFAGIMERSKREGWELVALDLGVDTTTPSGRMMANVLASFAQYERELIGQRTRDALREKAAAGVRIGRPPSVPLVTRQRIQAMRDNGMTLRGIAESLNADNIPTGQGGRSWYHTTVRNLLA